MHIKKLKCIINNVKKFSSKDRLKFTLQQIYWYLHLLFSLLVAAALRLPVVVAHAVHHAAVQLPPGLCIQCFYC